jgi:hypothetical protein
MTSMPFWNLTPWTTFGNWFSPFNRRHVFAAALTSLNTMSLAVLADRLPWSARFVAEAVYRLVSERLLLAEDGDRLAAAARESWDVYQAL